MKGKQTALMPGNGDKVGYWLTPPNIMAELRTEFHFDFDACPFPRPAGFDGLLEDWDGERIWCNPPFAKSKTGGLTAWARKSVEENGRGKLVVFIGPLWHWQEILLRAGAEVRDVGRVRWIAPDGSRQPSGHPQGLFILRQKPVAWEGGSGEARGGYIR